MTTTNLMDTDRLETAIFDAIAAKRSLKVGYVRQPGGLYPIECDTVAGHSFAVGVLALKLGYEVQERVAQQTGVRLNVGEIAEMSYWHDYGEAKSGDTGAQSHAIYGDQVACKLFRLERDGLETTVRGLKVEERALKLWDDYRGYRTPESIVVHIADNLEGFEKALHAARGVPGIIQNALKSYQDNIGTYRSKRQFDGQLGDVAELLVEEILIPGTQRILDAYGIRENAAELVQKTIPKDQQIREHIQR